MATCPTKDQSDERNLKLWNSPIQNDVSGSFLERSTSRNFFSQGSKNQIQELWSSGPQSRTSKAFEGFGVDPNRFDSLPFLKHPMAARGPQ